MQGSAGTRKDNIRRIFRVQCRYAGGRFGESWGVPAERRKNIQSSKRRALYWVRRY